MIGDINDDETESGIVMKSGANSIKLDSEAHSVRSSESDEEFHENESDNQDDGDDDALGKTCEYQNILV